MDFKEIKKNVKESWNWIWNSDSVLSWVVALALIFVVVKFVFFPTLSLITGSSLPLAGVESSSMDHQIAKDDSEVLSLCGKVYSKEEKEYIDFDEYWDVCGSWYEEREITKEIFSRFTLKNGFKKGDIIIVWGRFKPKLGDIIIFKPNVGSSAPRPIIHRIVSIGDKNGESVIQTKGDHNEKQLTAPNNIYHTDETQIRKEQLIGKAVFKIPYLGWVKIWAMELLDVFV